MFLSVTYFIDIKYISYNILLWVLWSCNSKTRLQWILRASNSKVRWYGLKEEKLFFMWTGFIWLRISHGRLLWTQYWIFGSH